MVAQQLLELPVGVRIPARQPYIIKGRDKRGFEGKFRTFNEGVLRAGEQDKNR